MVGFELGVGERLLNCCVMHRHTGPAPGIMVWGAARELLATDHVILNHGQVTWTTPELTSPSPNYHTNGKTFELSTDLTRDKTSYDPIPRPLGYHGLKT
ncbi:hypothetical protein TNCV_2312661 [Trichonephila clavipes]|nr:hypothetical protein TNCV_2312661 [Trichonephila clavipes]